MSLIIVIFFVIETELLFKLLSKDIFFSFFFLPKNAQNWQKKTQMTRMLLQSFNGLAFHACPKVKGVHLCLFCGKKNDLCACEIFLSWAFKCFLQEGAFKCFLQEALHCLLC